ncbi:MAG TPA: geranylgeranyl reductase family protein [Gaiellaceae bacterium]|nr:geranylgeranyl reductase family protein [Gaiellaceae bacterium]
MERFDAIVVGAGPAGSTTAYRLARAGSNVLLLDRARFPRDKPCGGGLTIRAVRQMPVPPDPVVEHVVDRMGFRLDYRSRFERGGREPLILMTQRRRLDHYLVEQAAAAGATVRDGVKVADVTVGERAVRVAVDGAPVEAAALVAADGANGTTRRALDLGGEYVLGVALEGNAARGVVGDRYDGLAEFELGTIPGGYGWIFPKGDHVNVGVGGWEREGPSLRRHLRILCRAHGIPESAVTDLRGHRLPLRRAGSVAARGRALLVGDAAGLVDPLSGDGMYEAFVSSRLAADAVLDLLAGRVDRLDGYTERLAGALALGAAASWGAKAAFDRYPRLTFALGRIPFAWSAVEHMLRGEISHPGDEQGPSRWALKLIEALARAAGDPGSGYRVEASTA